MLKPAFRADIAESQHCVPPKKRFKAACEDAGKSLSDSPSNLVGSPGGTVLSFHVPKEIRDSESDQIPKSDQIPTLDHLRDSSDEKTPFRNNNAVRETKYCEAPFEKPISFSSLNTNVKYETIAKPRKVLQTSTEHKEKKKKDSYSVLAVSLDGTPKNNENIAPSKRRKLEDSSSRSGSERKESDEKRPEDDKQLKDDNSRRKKEEDLRRRKEEDLRKKKEDEMRRKREDELRRKKEEERKRDEENMKRKEEDKKKDFTDKKVEAYRICADDTTEPPPLVSSDSTSTTDDGEDFRQRKDEEFKKRKDEDSKTKDEDKRRKDDDLGLEDDENKRDDIPKRRDSEVFKRKSEDRKKSEAEQDLFEMVQMECKKQEGDTRRSHEDDFQRADDGARRKDKLSRPLDSKTPKIFKDVERWRVLDEERLVSAAVSEISVDDDYLALPRDGAKSEAKMQDPSVNSFKAHGITQFNVSEEPLGPAVSSRSLASADAGQMAFLTPDGPALSPNTSSSFSADFRLGKSEQDLNHSGASCERPGAGGSPTPTPSGALSVDKGNAPRSLRDACQSPSEQPASPSSSCEIKVTKRRRSRDCRSDLPSSSGASSSAFDEDRRRPDTSSTLSKEHLLSRSSSFVEAMELNYKSRSGLIPKGPSAVGGSLPSPKAQCAFDKKSFSGKMTERQQIAYLQKMAELEQRRSISFPESSASESESDSGGEGAGSPDDIGESLAALFADHAVQRKPWEHVEIGDIVWAKIEGQPWWPAQITEPGSEPPTKPSGLHGVESVHVYFFGTHNRCWVREKSVLPFWPYYEEKSEGCCSRSQRRSFKRGLREAKEAALLLQVDDTDNAAGHVDVASTFSRFVQQRFAFVKACFRGMTDEQVHRVVSLQWESSPDNPINKTKPKPSRKVPELLAIAMASRADSLSRPPSGQSACPSSFHHQSGTPPAPSPVSSSFHSARSPCADPVPDEPIPALHVSDSLQLLSVPSSPVKVATISLPSLQGSSDPHVLDLALPSPRPSPKGQPPLPSPAPSSSSSTTSHRPSLPKSSSNRSTSTSKPASGKQRSLVRSDPKDKPLSDRSRKDEDAQDVEKTKKKAEKQEKTSGPEKGEKPERPERSEKLEKQDKGISERQEWTLAVTNGHIANAQVPKADRQTSGGTMERERPLPKPKAPNVPEGQGPDRTQTQSHGGPDVMEGDKDKPRVLHKIGTLHRLTKLEGAVGTAQKPSGATVTLSLTRKRERRERDSESDSDHDAPPSRPAPSRKRDRVRRGRGSGSDSDSDAAPPARPPVRGDGPGRPPAPSRKFVITDDGSDSEPESASPAVQPRVFRRIFQKRATASSHINSVHSPGAGRPSREALDVPAEQPDKGRADEVADRRPAKMCPSDRELSGAVANGPTPPCVDKTKQPMRKSEGGSAHDRSKYPSEGISNMASPRSSQARDRSDQKPGLEPRGSNPSVPSRAFSGQSVSGKPNSNCSAPDTNAKQPSKSLNDADPFRPAASKLEQRVRDVIKSPAPPTSGDSGKIHSVSSISKPPKPKLPLPKSLGPLPTNLNGLKPSASSACGPRAFDQHQLDTLVRVGSIERR